MLKNPHLLCLSIFLFLASMQACQHKPSGHEETAMVKADSLPKADVSVEGSFSDQRVLLLDSLNIGKILGGFPLLKKYSSDVEQFYRYRNFSYAWYETTGLIEQASHLYTRLSDLEDEGVLVKAPYLNNLDSLMNDPSVTGKA